MWCGGEANGDLQAADQATDSTLGRSQYGGSRGKVAALCSGLEGLLPVVANSKCLANAGRVDAAPLAGDSAQTLEPRSDNVSGIESAGCLGNGGTTSGWEFTQMVAELCQAIEHDADHCLL